MHKELETKNLFLSDSYNEQLKKYYKLLNKTTSDFWDVVVITASNEKQAESYQQQIDIRLKNNLLPQKCKYVIIPDPDNKRVGSGGATLNVIQKLKNDFLELDKLKILLIHSGGDSKRIPQYSAVGKLFSPVPRELVKGFNSTLFDELLIMFSSVCLRMDPGVLITCGDALLLFNPLQMDYQYKDVVSVSMKAPLSSGKNHGVIVSDEDGTVTKFLHKSPEEVLINAGAVRNNSVNIDTGVLYFSNKTCNFLLEMIEGKENLFINENTRLNLYGDILYPLASDSKYENYLKEPAEIEINDNIINARTLIWELRKKINYSLIKMSPASFIHFGTTGELLDLMTNKIKKYKSIGWKQHTNSIAPSNITAINSLIMNSKTKKGYIENSIVENCVLGNNIIISNTIIKNQEVPDNTCISTIKTNSGYITRVYNNNDNPKNNLEHSSFKDNNIIDKLIKDRSIDLWNAKIYPEQSTIEDSVNTSLNIYKSINNEYYDENDTHSFCSSYNKAIHVDYSELSVKILFEELISSITKREELNKIIESLNNYIYINELIEYINKNIDCYEYYYKIRLYYVLYKLDIENSQIYINKIFKTIKELVSDDYLMDKCDYSVVNDKVEVNFPVRINLGGGWTDTPPYCIENGGKVLNAAIKLNGRLPINVIIEKTKNRDFILDSQDLGAKKEMLSIEEIKECTNPNDPFALVKSAIIISGLISKSDANLDDVFNKIGGGIRVVTSVKNVPRGSGLGTSSILSGALIKALSKFMGIEKSNNQISDDVLRLEQLMSTGGGWQDQVGGIFPGLKLITSKAGVPQKLNVEIQNLSFEETSKFNEKLILINTGQRRLARNLLRDIVMKYISNDRITLKVLNDIQIIADKQFDSLKAGDYQQFGELLNEHWELIKKMDPGCTNLCIDTIINVINDSIYGKALCGAGGGGFIMAILKDNVTIEDIVNKLDNVFADTDVQVYRIELYGGEK